MRKTIVLFAAILALASMSYAEEAHTCSNATLNSSYGFVITGTRPVPPPNAPGIESVVGTAITTFDGQTNPDGLGGFTQTDNIHGSVSGYTPDRPGHGTYKINADCTGTMTLYNEGVPFGLVLSIVVVDNGKEIRAAVVDTTADPNHTAPPPIMVTSNGKRIQ
jgi:hypothetical protein